MDGDGVFEVVDLTATSIGATYSPPSGGNFRIRSFLEFDISSLVKGTQITSAALTVIGAGGSTLPMDLLIYGYQADGIGSVADASAGTLVSTRTFTPGPMPGTPIVFDFTAYVQGFVNQGLDFVGFNFRNDETSPRSFGFWSSQNTSGYSAPQLDVVAAPVPEPTTMLLLGIGLAGLAGAEVRRRRKVKAVDNS